MTVNFSGFFIGASIVITIFAGHHLVRWANYHFGTVPALFLFPLGIFISAISLLVSSELLSAILGIAGITTVVDAIEILKQEKRIARGHAKMNPKRVIEKLNN